MKVLFFGTPDIAVYSFESIVRSKHKIIGVVTVPDKPAGRGLKINMPPVKIAAQKYNITVFQPENLEDNQFTEAIRKLNPDVGVIVAFRKLPDKLWKIPPKGTINLHASLLPQYRGAAPINHAIINGETETGLTTFFINEDIDKGNIIDFIRMKIDDNDNAETLEKRMYAEGARLLIKTLDSLETGQINITQQDELIIRYNITELKKAPKIHKSDCRINWNLSAKEIRNLIRGLSPVPGAYSTLEHISGKKFILKIFKAEYCNSIVNINRGQVIFSKNDMFAGTGDNGCLLITEIQPESKSKMNVKDFINGLQYTKGWFFRDE